MCRNLINAFQCIIADHIGMSIIMHNHVHLCDTCNFIIDFDSVEVLLRKIMPITIVVSTAFFVILGSLMTNVIQCIQQEPTRPTGSIQHIPVVFRLHHLYSKFNDRTRSKILAKITFEKSVHELFKCNAFYIKVRFVQVNCFKMGDHRSQHSIIHFDRVSKDLRIFLFLLIVQSIDSFSQFRSRLVRLYLKLVRLTFFPWFLLITNFYKNQFTQFAKGGRRGKATTSPQRLVAFFNSCN